MTLGCGSSPPTLRATVAGAAGRASRSNRVSSGWLSTGCGLVTHDLARPAFPAGLVVSEAIRASLGDGVVCVDRAPDQGSPTLHVHPGHVRGQARDGPSTPVRRGRRRMTVSSHVAGQTRPPWPGDRHRDRPSTSVRSGQRRGTVPSRVHCGRGPKRSSRTSFGRGASSSIATATGACSNAVVGNFDGAHRLLATSSTRRWLTSSPGCRSKWPGQSAELLVVALVERALDEALLVGVARGLGAVGDVELAVDVRQVELDRLRGDPELLRDRGVRLALRERGQDRELAGGQAGGLARRSRCVSSARPIAV